jgi:hypothetical protein
MRACAGEFGGATPAKAPPSLLRKGRSEGFALAPGCCGSEGRAPLGKFEVGVLHPGPHCRRAPRPVCDCSGEKKTVTPGRCNRRERRRSRAYYSGSEHLRSFALGRKARRTNRPAQPASACRSGARRRFWLARACRDDRRAQGSSPCSFERCRLRKVWGGNRTWVGARAQAVLMSVWRTCWQQGRSALDYLSQRLRGAPVALALPP